MFDVKTHSNLL